MLDVYFTIDVEIWCHGWQDLDAKFPDSFDYYIHGPRRQYGLPYQLRVLRDHGLRGVCFVETVFAERFGRERLAEIVDIVEGGGHEVQLHLHPEWITEARTPIFSGTSTRRRSSMCDLNLAEQSQLMQVGLKRLEEVGATRPNAFRAGNFGFNGETMLALRQNGIGIDASYDASLGETGRRLNLDRMILEPSMIEGVIEVPMTVFSAGAGRLRHAQLTACSFKEMEGLLWKAVEMGYKSFVILSHGNELTKEVTRRVEPVVLRRFHQLCALLEKHRDVFNVRGLHGAPPRMGESAVILSSPYWKAGLRMAEQLVRRVHIAMGKDGKR